MNSLPAYKGNQKLIVQDQDTPDIIREVYQAHKFFAPDYDTITKKFISRQPVELAKEVFDFCKENLNYRIESEDFQTTRSPAGILYTKNVDCKHYAGFTAGVLDAMRRKYNLDFELFYRFANYNIFDTVPGHVFTVMKYNGNEYWIDPVLDRFNKREPLPISFTDKKIRNMLVRLSGITPPQIMSERVKKRLSAITDTKLGSVYDQYSKQLANTLNEATASIPFVSLAQGLIKNFFGAGGISDWITPAGIINEIKSAIFGRAFRGGQYWLGEKFRYYVLGENIHTKDADIVTDAVVTTAITTFSVGFGVPIEDYQDILNLQKGADAYIARYKMLGADQALIDRGAVDRAVMLKRNHFPTEFEGNWQASGVAPKKWDLNMFNSILFVVPIPDFTKDYPEMWKNTFTGVIPDGEVKQGIVIAGKLAMAVPKDLQTGSATSTSTGMSTGTLLLIGAGVVGAYFLLRKKR